MLFPHRLGLPYKRSLRNLMADYLRQIIQDNGECRAVGPRVAGAAGRGGRGLPALTHLSAPQWTGTAPVRTPAPACTW